MMRSEEDRVADVRRILAAAKAIRSSPTLEAELVRTTKLSREGVRLALDEHLEFDATDAEIAELIRRAGDCEKVLVILSANVFVGALRAIAIARAASGSVVVRPSSREPTFAKALVAVANDPALTLVADVGLERWTGEVHVYGRDETIASVVARAPRAHVRGHGAGFGLAWVSGDEIEAASAVARDVVPFDQRGCLSPRIVLVGGDASRADIFARALASELERFETKVPRGELEDDERAEASRYRGTMAFAGELYDGPTFAVGVGIELTLPPPGRHVHVVPCADDGAAAKAIAPLARYVAALGMGAAAPALISVLPGARRSELGRMQRPPLDGPVDLRPPISSSS